MNWLRGHRLLVAVVALVLAAAVPLGLLWIDARSDGPRASLVSLRDHGYGEVEAGADAKAEKFLEAFTRDVVTPATLQYFYVPEEAREKMRPSSILRTYRAMRPINVIGRGSDASVPAGEGVPPLGSVFVFAGRGRETPSSPRELAVALRANFMQAGFRESTGLCWPIDGDERLETLTDGTERMAWWVSKDNDVLVSMLWRGSDADGAAVARSLEPLVRDLPPDGRHDGPPSSCRDPEDIVHAKTIAGWIVDLDLGRSSMVLCDTSGDRRPVRLGPSDSYEFPLSHLAEHQDEEAPIEVRLAGDGKVAVAITDAQLPGSPTCDGPEARSRRNSRVLSPARRGPG